jgi:hypoxanthine phosphoribosyltransferase
MRVTWQEIEQAVDVLATTIRSGGIPDLIVAIPRGGWIPAVMLGHRLNIPVQSLAMPVCTSKVLVVDDICDTGKTLWKIMQQLSLEARSATLFYKYNTTYDPTYYARETKEWIVFPWEG